MSSPRDEARQLIQKAAAALKQGDKDGAWQLAERAAYLAPNLEQPWLLMAALANPKDSSTYIEKALKINPDSQRAQQAFIWATERLKIKPVENRDFKYPKPVANLRPIEEDASAIEIAPYEKQGTAHDQVSEELNSHGIAKDETETHKFSIPSTSIPKRKHNNNPTIRERVFLWALLGLFLVGISGLIILWPTITNMLGFTAPNPTPTVLQIGGPTAQPITAGTVVPTPPCSVPNLALGNKNYQIDSVAGKPNEFSIIPPGNPDTAYWIEETTIHYAFALSPTVNNLGLKNSLKLGDPVMITWSDCDQEEYVVASIETIQAGDLAIMDQTVGGLTVYVQDDAANTILVMQAERPIIQSSEPIENPTESPIQLDIQFDYDLAPPDDQSITIGLMITNQGATTVILSSTDISMTVEGESPVFPSILEPSLPLEILSSNTVTLTVTFPKPRASMALLKILDLTLDYYIR